MSQPTEPENTMYSININGETIEFYPDDHTGDLSVSFPREDGGDRRCVHCGEPVYLSEPIEGEPDEAGPVWAHGDEGADEFCDAGGDPEPEPEVPANSVRASWDEDGVTVAISVGDPRGAFVMRVERMRDGTMRLSVPHPDDRLPHMELEPLASSGYYLIKGA